MAAETRSPVGEQAAAQRLLSLDAFRGFVMLWIVGGGTLVKSFREIDANWLTDWLVYQLEHSDWIGLRFYDLIWPGFMLMTGMSLPFSYRSRLRRGASHREILRHVAWRCTILFLLGSLRESIHLKQPFLIELSSALQPIAIAYFCAFLLVRWEVRAQAAVASAIWAGYAALLAFVPPASYERGNNLVLLVDLATLGRALPEGWGTVLSTVPTISTTILGLILGRVLMSPATGSRKALILAAVGAACFGAGWALSPVIPIIMKLWTTSYGLASTGAACLMFAAFYWLIDVRGCQRWTLPLVVIGRNALAAYLGQTLVPLRSHVAIFTQAPAAALGTWGPAFGNAVYLAVEWLILYWMYKRKIFLTA